MSLWEAYELNEIMPKNTCLILVYPDIGSDIYSFILDHWPALAFIGWAEQLSKFAESRKTPVAFFGIEPMLRRYAACQLKLHVYNLAMVLQWCRYIDGSFLFHITSVNCTQAYQPSGAFSSSSWPCSRYNDA